ncbi:acyl-CoA dehydrogenase [Nocardia sp. NPDC050435]|uniref:acyl-CoA dehydrogenase n=1 Tax=Nocardia sp. NPDC050435 TaxID=3155040 RepID=UPI0033C37C5F
MPDTVLSRRDLDFLLHEWLDTEDLFHRGLYAAHSRGTVDDALALAEQMATQLFAPHNRAADLAEPTFDGNKVEVIPEVAKALRAYTDAGFQTAALPESLGGMGLPYSVFAACTAWFNAANAATTSYALLTLGAVNLLARHGSGEHLHRYLDPMLAGRFFGTMALSEPHAGSSLADITTRAEPQPDGSYRLFGRKMWISGGDHDLSENIVHLVLARTPNAPAGTRGISLFLVPKYLLDEHGERGERNDVVLAGINHKMGYRGTVNTAPVFGDGAHRPGGVPGAIGYLVGGLHRGMSVMFSMMNEARIGVGLCATALGYTGYLKSLAYARDRIQGRAVGALPDDGPVPLVDHPDVRRMLLAQKSYVEGALALELYCARLVDDIASLADYQQRNDATQLLAVLTPIAKSWPSQWCLHANDLAIQVLGGAGYTRDHDIEQHYRDNRLNAIHEGTHGIQGMDLLGRKILLDAGAALQLLVMRMRSTTARARATGSVRAEGYAAQLDAAIDRLVEVTTALPTLGDLQAMLAESTAYLEASGHIVVGWLWLEQWLVAYPRGGSFYDGKRAATRYFYTRELPKVQHLLDLLAASDDLLLSLDPQDL